MEASGDRSGVAVMTTLRWAAITIGCVFAADRAVEGETSSVVAVGLGVLVAVWWTLRPELVVVVEDLVAIGVLVVADVLSHATGAFVPAIVIALIGIVGRNWIGDAAVRREGLDLDSLPTHPLVEPDTGPEPAAPARVDPAVIASIAADERRRAARLYDRVHEWLTYVQVGLDRHLVRRPDYQLSKLRDDVTDSIREVEERSRQLRALVTPNTPLSAHAGRLLEWWSHHYGGDVTLQITDPDASLPVAVEQQLLAILQEAVDNAGRHSAAERLTVRWEVTDERGLLRVSDDGEGFDGAATDGRGLATMRIAAERAGAELTIDSEPGSGTTVQAVVTR